MEPKGSLPYSQELTSCPCPEPYQASPHPPILFLYNLTLCSHLCIDLPSGHFTSGFPSKTLYEVQNALQVDN